MDTTAIPDTHLVTLAWTVTSTAQHTLTLYAGQLREELNKVRERRNLPHRADLAGDLALLEEFWLADYDREPGPDVERRVTGLSVPHPAEPPTFTVSIDDSHEEYGCPHTYVLHAPDLDTAKYLAVGHHTATTPCQVYGDADILEGPWWTFPGQPTWPSGLSGRTWHDLRENADLLTRAFAQAGAR